MENEAPDFANVAVFFRQARDHFKAHGMAPTPPSKDAASRLWILSQKERLMSRLAAHWQFLRRCKLYNVQPSHLTERGMQMTFTCALISDEIRASRVPLAHELKAFIESCGFSCTSEVTDSIISFEMRLLDV